MGTYSLEHIIQEWSKGKLTSEQVIGQMLQLIHRIKNQITDLEARLLRLERRPG